MKLTIKSLKGEQFPIDVDPSMLVKDAKEHIKGVKGWEVESQKLIIQGKIMENDKALQDYKVKEGGFLVCMVTKPKAPKKTPAAPATQTTESTPTPAATTETPAAAPPPSTSTAAPEAAAPSTTTTTATTETTTATATAPSAAAASPFAGPDFEANVTQLKDMGFVESDCRAALRAGFGDLSRAVDYLTNGIPPEAAAAADAQASSAGTPAAAGSTTPAAAAPPATATSDEPLAALRQHPRLNDLRRIVQSDPSQLSTVLAEIGRSNQALLQEINANREDFVRIMNEPVDEAAASNVSTAQAAAAVAGGAAPGVGGGTPAAQGGPGGAQQVTALLQAMQQMSEPERNQLAQAMGVPPEQLQAITQMMQNMPPEAMQQMMAAMMQGGLGGGGPGAAGGPPGAAPGQRVIHVTPEEAAAIDRLAELGFPKTACLEAYRACDNNEQLAANYLFTNPPEPMMDDSDAAGGGAGDASNGGGDGAQ